jgi:hypothetical protein
VFHSETHIPLPGLSVKAFDANQIGVDDYLGSAVTDRLGHFMIPYRDTDLVKNFLKPLLGEVLISF